MQIGGSYSSNFQQVLAHVPIPLGLKSLIHNHSRTGPEKSQWANTSMLDSKWKGSASAPKQGDFF